MGKFLYIIGHVFTPSCWSCQVDPKPEDWRGTLCGNPSISERVASYVLSFFSIDGLGKLGKLMEKGNSLSSMMQGRACEEEQVEVERENVNEMKDEHLVRLTELSLVSVNAKLLVLAGLLGCLELGFGAVPNFGILCSRGNIPISYLPLTVSALTRSIRIFGLLAGPLVNIIYSIYALRHFRILVDRKKEGLNASALNEEIQQVRIGCNPCKEESRENFIKKYSHASRLQLMVAYFAPRLFKEFYGREHILPEQARKAWSHFVKVYKNCSGYITYPLISALILFIECISDYFFVQSLGSCMTPDGMDSVRRGFTYSKLLMAAVYLLMSLHLRHRVAKAAQDFFRKLV